MTTLVALAVIVLAIGVFVLFKLVHAITALHSRMYWNMVSIKSAVRDLTSASQKAKTLDPSFDEDPRTIEISRREFVHRYGSLPEHIGPGELISIRRGRTLYHYRIVGEKP